MPDNLPVRLVGLMALVALVIGTSLSVSATGRIDLSLVLSTSIGWSFVPILQLVTGLILVRGVRRRGQALTAYFATHRPWSLWIVAVHALVLFVAPAREATLWMALSAVIPAALTVRLLLALCEEEMGLSRPVARRRVAVHQVLSYALILSYVAVVVALWPRIA